MSGGSSDIKYSFGTDAEPAFTLTFPRCSREPETWVKEIYRAAHGIMNRAQKPIWLCSSGGIDSEVMCRAFYDQGIHFSVISIEHAAKTNEHDIKYAKKWCYAHGITHNVVSLDMHEFLTKEVRTYAAQSFVTRNIFRYFQIKLLETVERLGGYAVLGGGEQLYKADTADGNVSREDLFLEFESGYAVPLEWSKRNNTTHEPYFYFSSPELMLSFPRIPFLSALLDHPEVFASPINGFLTKRIAYNTLWPDTEPRKKYSGYEKISPLRKGAQAFLGETFGTRIQTYRLPLVQLERDLIPEVSSR